MIRPAPQDLNVRPSSILNTGAGRATPKDWDKKVRKLEIRITEIKTLLKTAVMPQAIKHLNKELKKKEKALKALKGKRKAERRKKRSNHGKP